MQFSIGPNNNNRISTIKLCEPTCFQLDGRSPLCGALPTGVGARLPTGQKFSLGMDLLAGGGGTVYLRVEKENLLAHSICKHGSKVRSVRSYCGVVVYGWVEGFLDLRERLSSTFITIPLGRYKGDFS